MATQNESREVKARAADEQRQERASTTEAPRNGVRANGYVHATVDGEELVYVPGELLPEWLVKHVPALPDDDGQYRVAQPVAKPGKRGDR